MGETALLLALLALSAFFSSSETALTSLTMVRVDSLLKEGRHGAHALHRLKSNNNRMLIAILIGNNVVNIGASAIATVLATEHFGHLGPGLAVGALTLIILIFGEIAPKTFAARHAAAVALFAAPPLLLFSAAAFPLVWMLEWLTLKMQHLSTAKVDPVVTESELITLADHGAKEGSIEESERRMIRRIFEFDDLNAADIMIPRHKIVAMDGRRTLNEARPELVSQPHSHIPLHGGALEEISKVVFLRDLLKTLAEGGGERTLFECGEAPLFVHANQSLEELFISLRGRKHKLILVVDDLGVLQGLFTLEDVVEELVGEIHDEGESPMEAVVILQPGEEISVDGALELRVVEEYFALDLGGKPTDSVNSWILNQTMRIPASGDRLSLEGLSVLVERASPRAIRKVRLTRASTG